MCMYIKYQNVRMRCCLQEGYSSSLYHKTTQLHLFYSTVSFFCTNKLIREMDVEEVTEIFVT